jgi:hypothetical protein
MIDVSRRYSFELKTIFLYKLISFLLSSEELYYQCDARKIRKKINNDIDKNQTFITL